MQLDDISFDWSGVGPYQSQNPKTTEIHFTTLYPLSYSTIIRVKGTNSCGVSQEFSKTIWVDDCDWNEGDPEPDPPFNGLIVKFHHIVSGISSPSGVFFEGVAEKENPRRG
jgi:hypothetical protein